MSEARKILRDAVRGAWDEQEALIAIQDELKKEGYKLLHDAYRWCIEKGTKPIKECYREKAKEKGLAAAYRRIWGSPGGTKG